MKQLMFFVLTALAACGGDDKHASPGDGDSGPQTTTLAGTLVSVSGVTLPHVPMQLWNAGATSAMTVTTTSGGAFTFADVTAPYDLIATVSGKPVYFLGLTRTDPTVVVPVASALTSTSSGFTGNITPAAANPASTTQVIVADCHDGFVIDELPGSQTSYIATVLGNRDSAQCIVTAMRFEPNGDLASPFAEAAGPGSLISGQDTQIDLQFADLTTAPVAVSLEVSGENKKLRSLLVWRGGAHGAWLQSSGGTAEASFSLLTATNLSSSFAVSATAADPSRPDHAVVAVTTLASSPLSIALPAPIDGLTPAAGASTIDMTTQIFAVTELPNELYVYVFGTDLSAPSAVIVSSSATLDMSTIASRGASFPSQTQTLWQVSGYDGIADMDHFADGSFAQQTNLTGDSLMRTTGQLVFTTK
jgi:hypothetical protein